MAELFVRNSLNSKQTVKFNLGLKEYVPKGNNGESVWVLVVGTMHLDLNGEKIPQVNIHNVSEDTVEDEINSAVSSICNLIDWAILEDDKSPPYISEFSPVGDNVRIKSKVEFKIQDTLPSSGIDTSDMVVTLNNGQVDFDITSEVIISGDPYDYNVVWLPTNIAG